MKGQRMVVRGIGPNQADAMVTAYGEWAVVTDPRMNAPYRYAVAHRYGRWIDWGLRRSQAHALARALAGAVPPFPGDAGDMRALANAARRSPHIRTWVDGVTRVRDVLHQVIGA